MGLKQRIVRGVTVTAAAYGYELTPQWRLDVQPLARHLRAVFARHAIDCVLDVGANKGQYHDLLRTEVGYEGPIVSFEPVRQYLDLLERRATEDPLWTVVPYALGSERADTEINVTSSPGLNSFLEPRNDAVAGFWDKESIVKETVHIERLDQVFGSLQQKIGFTRPYLKLDTQGFDLQVITGAGDVLSQVRALQTEASVKPIYAAMPTWRETVDTMTSLGFHLSGMFPVSLDDDLRLVEFDCVMVR